MCNGAALKRSPPDYVTAEAYYRLGYESRDIKLEEIAKGFENVTSGEYVNRSMELFDDEAWMHGMLQDAFAGDGIFEDMDDLRRATVGDKRHIMTHISRFMFLSSLSKSFYRAAPYHTVFFQILTKLMPEPMRVDET